MMTEFKKSMMQAFDIIDLGKDEILSWHRDYAKLEGIFVCQKKYVTDILKFTMSKSKFVNCPVVPYFKINIDANGATLDHLLQANC